MGFMSRIHDEQQPDGPALTSELMRQYSRELSHAIWLRGQAGERLEGEARLYKAMRLHPEYHRLWDRLDRLGEAGLTQAGVDPLLHVQMHAMVEAQRVEKDPPEVEAALKALLRRGFTRHQAVHEVGALVAQELYHMLNENRVFDLDGYVRELRRLIRGR